MPTQPTASKARATSKLLILVGLLLVAGFAFWHYRDLLSLEFLATQEARLRELLASKPLLAYVASFAVYVLVTGLSLPGATVLTLALAWLLGFWRALVLVSFASTTGATVAFLLSRYLLRDAVQRRFGERLRGFNQALEREGAFYLFTLRLIPAVPFFVINLVMGLTPLKTTTFWWVSQVGMLPGTAAYTYAGSTVPSLAELAHRGVGGIVSGKLLLAFAILGLFPLIAKKIIALFRPSEAPHDVPS
jgi:uncharacterized membrane protein YdjX (TVP38/TMEM64 family)